MSTKNTAMAAIAIQAPSRNFVTSTVSSTTPVMTAPKPLIDWARRIRLRAATAEIPAIALTAFTRQDDRVKALQAGFTDYLAKPVEPAALAAAIRRAVARGGEEQAARPA